MPVFHMNFQDIHFGCPSCIAREEKRKEHLATSTRVLADGYRQASDLRPQQNNCRRRGFPMFPMYVRLFSVTRLNFPQEEVSATNASLLDCIVPAIYFFQWFLCLAPQTVHILLRSCRYSVKPAATAGCIFPGQQSHMEAC